MESGGGTRVWCSQCDAIRECKVLWYDNYSKGNFFHKEYDLHWRARPRECNTCGGLFTTYEIDSSIIQELISLRKLIIEIQSKIEVQNQYPTEILKFLYSEESD